MNFVAPKELHKWQEQLAKTVLPFVTITAKTAQCAPTASKFGGVPYWPASRNYPTGSSGFPLYLLAQINFADVPPHDLLPKQGILQFFIANDTLFGADFDRPTEQVDFKVIYHATTDEAQANDLPAMPDDFVIPEEKALSFGQSSEPMTLSDFRSEATLPEEILAEDTLTDEYYDHVSGAGHKILGYPYFTQDDPRSYNKSLRSHLVLLLQVDSDDDNGMMWGDCGVANFFIREEDLRQLNFTNVIYNWDCH